MRRIPLVIVILFAAQLAVSATAMAETNPYLEAGIPAPTRKWFGPDYKQTVEVLTAGKVPLPRLSDPQGAVILRRITSTDNLSLERNESLPLTVRMQDFLQVQQAATAISKLYLGAMTREDYRPELARLTAFVLHTSAQGVDLAEEILPTIPKDEKYATRMEGLRRMNEGLTTTFVAAERMLTEQNGFSAPDLSALLDAMATTLPRLKKSFPPDVQIELRKKLVADKARFKKDEDAKGIDRMIGELGGT